MKPHYHPGTDDDRGHRVVLGVGIGFLLADKLSSE